MSDLNSLLREEIQREFEKLKKEDLDDQQHKTVVDGLTKLMDREIELEKLENEERHKALSREEAVKQAEFERKLKTTQAEEARVMDEFERKLKTEQAEFDKETKLNEIQAEQRRRLITIFVDVAGIVLPVIVTVWGTKKSFEFEKEGTITTIMGRGFINKLLPKK